MFPYFGPLFDPSPEPSAGDPAPEPSSDPIEFTSPGDDAPPADFDLNHVFAPGANEGDPAQLFKGKYAVADNETPVTREMIEGNPELLGVVKALYNAQARITQLHQGRIELGEPITPDEFGALDFELSDEGRFSDATRKALLGRPIDEHLLQQYEQTLDMATRTQRTEVQEWNKQATTAVGGPEVLKWIVDWVGHTYSQAELDVFNAQMAGTNRTRDAALATVIGDILASGAVPPEGATLDAWQGTPGEPKKTMTVAPAANLPNRQTGGTYSGTTQQQVTGQYSAELAAAKGDKAKERAADARLERTFAMRGWNEKVKLSVT